MMSLWDALRMNMMISYQELVRTFPKQNELTATMVQFSPLPLKAFKGPLASFCGRSIIRAKVG
ncbi:hypothetical protein DN614_31590 [Klebsiella michiganensis]|nr:hypothetical protein DN614_31590 [Klebsiella michiganensis]